MKAIIYLAAAASVLMPPGNPEKTDTGNFNRKTEMHIPEILSSVCPDSPIVPLKIIEEYNVPPDIIEIDVTHPCSEERDCDDECLCYPFILVEIRPEFPGGDKALLDYIVHNVKYPEMAIDGCITGTVYIQFTITKKGKVDDVKVIRSVHPLLDEPALDVIKNLPDWIPGKQLGKPVNVSFLIPIKFTLDCCSSKQIQVFDKTKTDSLPVDTIESDGSNNELVPENLTTEIFNETRDVPVNIKVYPNPAADFVNLETTGFPEQSRYQILSINGKIISEGLLDNEKTMIGMDNVATGTYILVIYSADGSIRKTEKLIIRK